MLLYCFHYSRVTKLLTHTHIRALFIKVKWAQIQNPNLSSGILIYMEYSGVYFLLLLTPFAVFFLSPPFYEYLTFFYPFGTYVVQFCCRMWECGCEQFSTTLKSSLLFKVFTKRPIFCVCTLSLTLLSSFPFHWQPVICKHYIFTNFPAFRITLTHTQTIKRWMEMEAECKLWG